MPNLPSAQADPGGSWNIDAGALAHHVLPAMTLPEAIATNHIHSVAGLTGFFQVGYTASHSALVDALCGCWPDGRRSHTRTTGGFDGCRFGMVQPE